MTTDAGYEWYRLQDDLDRQQQKLDRLDRKHEDLAGDVEQLSSKHSELDGDLHRLTSQVSELANYRVAPLEETTGDLTSKLEEVGGAVKRLLGTVAWLERHVRTAGGPEAELDAASDGIDELANHAEEGQVAETMLLGVSEQRAKQAAIDRHEQAKRWKQQTLADALRHSRTLADSGTDVNAHGEAAEEYRTATAQLRKARREVESSRPAAEAAREALAADEQARPVYEPKVQRGRAASRELHRQMQARIAAAVSQGAVLPYWFAQALGHQPVGDSAPWIDTAARVLAYRITYQVTDPMQALGEPPPYPALPTAGSARSAGHGAMADAAWRAQVRRRSWHEQLTSEIKRLTQWP